MPKFLTITVLRPQTGELANRDDTGSAKTLVYGGVPRTRISSQAIKRRLRCSTGPYALTGSQVPDGSRSRFIFHDLIFPGIVSAGISEQDALTLSMVIKGAVLKSAKATGATDQDPDGSESQEEQPTTRAKRANRSSARSTKEGPVMLTSETLRTDQAIFLGQPEIDYLIGLAITAYKDTGNRDVPTAVKAITEQLSTRKGSENLTALVSSGGITTALFGRFITSDLLARTDAAVHVAHAFTVHGAEKVDDYFSAVDDIRPNEGSAHLDSTELTSGLMLISVVVGVDQLVQNLSCDRGTAAEVVRRLVMLLATESISAKKGSTAPYSRAQLVMVEAGDTQPRTLAAAFETPVKKGNTGWLEPAINQLADYMRREDKMYGLEVGAIRACATTALGELPSAHRCTLAELANAAANAVQVDQGSTVKPAGAIA